MSIKEIVFRPGFAVGLAYLDNPGDPKATKEAIKFLQDAGIDARVDAKVDYLLLKLPQSLLRQVNEHAGQLKMARHDALIMLVRSGLAAAHMAARLEEFRQSALENQIADALIPIRVSRRKAGAENPTVQ